MALYQNQLMQEKEVYLKNKNNICLIFIFFFLFNIFFSISNAEENKELYKLEILKYFNNISEFSSTFIQYDDESFQEGEFFFKKNRFKGSIHQTHKNSYNSKKK